MQKYILFIFFSCISITIYSQTNIAKQSFETTGDNWNITLSTPPCTDGEDSWNYQTSLASLNPSDGSKFWGVTDLNGTCGGSGFETISFENIDITEFRNIVLTIDYNAIELDNGDDIKYEIFLDNASQGEVILFEGGSNLSTNGWETELINIPNTSSQISFIIYIKQNGQDDYIGIDNIKLTGISISPCSELMISEYIEGISSSSYRNNFIEIYNPTNQIINLDNYNLTKFTNDNLNPTGEIPLIGTISAYGTYLIEDTTENLGINADLSSASSVMDFNGNDKIALRKDNEIIDLIGKIGDNNNFAEDVTLKRKSNIQTPNNQFDEMEWDIYGLEDMTDINSHVSSCSGNIPEIEIFGNFIEIIDGNLNSNSINNTYFGDINPVSQNEISKTFTIKNSGSENLIINSIEITGVNSTDFLLENNISVNVSPKDSIAFQVNFKPTSKGIKTATVQVNNNDASENPYNFIIQGEGTGSSNSPLMITQYYEGDGNNKWIEVTNISDTDTKDNIYFLALFMNEDAKNPVGMSPSRKKAIPALESGQTIKYSATLNVDTPDYAIDGNEIKTTVCIFNGDDIIIISTTDDETSWENKVDIIGNSSNWGQDKSYVRKYGCVNVKPSTGFHLEDWLEYEISEINSAFAEYNFRLGEHYVGSTTFDNSEKWDNGLPDVYRNAIIDYNYGTSIYGNLEVCNLTVNENKTLEVNNYISVRNNLNIDGTLNILHEASLVMVSDSGLVINNGTTNIYKTTNQLKKNDYTYWSSPVKNANLSEVFSASPQNSLYAFQVQNFSDKNEDGYDDDSNSWELASGDMEIGKGYTAMAPNTTPFVDRQSVVFNGEVNNGNINVPIYLSNDNDIESDDWNFIGNPYPSAISADSLLNNDVNKTILNGSIYFWTHNTTSNNGQYSSDDYAMYTLNTGGIMAISQGQIPTRNIASCQGFFVEAKQQGNLVFNNNMRVKTGNDNFFKEESKKNDNPIQKDKIWLNLYNDQGGFSQILIGFLEGASTSYESNYDGARLDGNKFLSFYSLAESQKLAIQGVPPFKGDEIIPLGFTSKIDEVITLKISIDHIEGIFKDQDIYLFDKTLNKIHHLNKEDYTFVLDNKGSFKDRFSIQFSNGVLDVENDQIKSVINEKLILLKDNNIIKIKTSQNTIINSIKIYDILGRSILQNKVNKAEVIISNNALNTNGVYIIHAKLNDSKILIKKFIP